MPNTDRFSLLERWANGAEAFRDAMETKYGPAPTPPQLPPYTTYDAMLEAIVDNTVGAKRLLNKKSPTYHSDSAGYTKVVPAGDVHYASLEQIGGKTLVWNQLLEPTTSITNNGVTGLTISVADGWITVSGTAETGGTLVVNPSIASVPANHKIFLQRDGGSFNWGRNGFAYQSADAFIHSHNVDFGCAIRIRIVQGETYNFTTRFNVIDMTLLFGAGNEPTTVAEFQQTFPAVWYAYNPGSLLSAGVTSVISKKADATTIATYPIPVEVQALEGYGWSAGSVYNYVDFERKVFVKNVGSVDLSTLTWGYGPSVGWSATLNAKNPADDDTVFNGISATLTPVTRNAQATAFSGGTDAGMVSVSCGKVYVGTGDIGIVPSGTLYYELDEPVETDVSEYITDDNLIEVEAGGSLTFQNQHGDDFGIDVPSSVTFVVGEP